MLTLFTGAQVRDRETLIQHIAKDVARLTLRHLQPATSNMNVAELRGYVRSRAAGEARAQVRLSIAEHRLQQECEADLTAAVLERAVHLAIRELSVQPVVSIPAPHVRLRIAA